MTSFLGGLGGLAGCRCLGVLLVAGAFLCRTAAGTGRTPLAPKAGVVAGVSGEVVFGVDWRCFEGS